jgi:integrase
MSGTSAASQVWTNGFCTSARLLFGCSRHMPTAKAVQRMLGHASAATTLDRYADLFDNDLDDMADRLDAPRRPPADQLRTIYGLSR